VTTPFCPFPPSFGLSQHRGSKPSACSPADKSLHSPPPWLAAVLLTSLLCCQRGPWYLQDAEGPQGSEHLLGALGAGWQPRAGLSPMHSPEEMGFSQGRKAAGAEPCPLELYCWSVYRTSPVGLATHAEQPATETRLEQV